MALEVEGNADPRDGDIGDGGVERARHCVQSKKKKEQLLPAIVTITLIFTIAVASQTFTTLFGSLKLPLNITYISTCIQKGWGSLVMFTGPFVRNQKYPTINMYHTYTCHGARI